MHVRGTIEYVRAKTSPFARWKFQLISDVFGGPMGRKMGLINSATEFRLMRFNDGARWVEIVANCDGFFGL